MATIREALAASQNLEGYEPVEKPLVGVGLPPQVEGQPTINPFLRCPMPPVGITPDSLRQYYVKGQVPQFRILTPAKRQTAGSGSTNISTTLTATTTATGGGTVAPPVNNTAAVNVSLTTAALNPNVMFLGSVAISKSFQLLGISANVACRIEIYGSQIDQLNDVSRQLDISPFPGTQQNLITDLALDSPPYQWSWQNRVGANSENPQNGTAYITVTNLSGASAAITVSLTYVPLESA